MYKILLLLMLLSVLVACSVHDFPGRKSSDTLFICLLDKYSPGFIERYKNKRHLNMLKKGMTKEEVYKIMGEPLIYEPYAKNSPNIWFYYTTWDWADAVKTKSECTPVIFEDGELIGWGIGFYRDYIHRDWLFSQEKVFDKYGLKG